MSDWVAEWVDNPNPSTPGTRAEIVLQDGSTVTVMDVDRVTVGVASFGGPPPEVVHLARAECGR